MEVTGNDGKQCTIEPGADLSQANLSGALLSGANLSGAKLIDADLNGANLVRVTYDGQTVFPVGFDPPDPSRVPSTSSSPLTGIKLLRVLAWTWIILCPIGGIVFWVVLENILGLQLF